MNDNTALWDAISAKHYNIFHLLYNYTTIQDPHTAGDLLTTATKRNDIAVIKDLLKCGLDVDSTNLHGLTALQVALTTNHVEIATLLIAYGAKTGDLNGNTISSIFAARNQHFVQVNKKRGNDSKFEPSCARINLFKGYPTSSNTFDKNSTGRLIRLPSSFEELQVIAGIILLNIRSLCIIALCFFSYTSLISFTIFNLVKLI